MAIKFKMISDEDVKTIRAARSALAEGGLDVSDYPSEDYGLGKPKGFVVRVASPDGRP